VRNLTAYIDICRQPTINADAEEYLYAHYRDVIDNSAGNDYCFNYGYYSFAQLVMANRYALQNEKAKSFLVLKSLRNIEEEPNEDLLNELETFLNKKKKTQYEEFLAYSGTFELGDFNKYIAYVKGVLRLTHGDFKEAKKQFEKSTRLKVSHRIFGNNLYVYYSEDEETIMRDDYINEFPFIHDDMNELEVTEALIQLQKIGEKKGDEAAKANYLIANFFYNVSRTGYFRQYLRFDNDNSFSYWKFGPDATAYENTWPLSVDYLEKAKKTAEDRDLMAHIIFASAKNAQELMEDSISSYWDYQIVLPQEQYNELDAYKDTEYHSAVYSNCLYYKYYH